MAKKDLYSSLKQIASESVGVKNQNEQANKDLINKQDIASISSVAETAARMYPNNKQKQFDYWKRNTNINGLTNDARNTYWKTYEKMHPRGLDGAKSDFINVTLIEMGYISGVSNKEFFLRDKVANSPQWAREVLEPELAKLSTTVANANLSKAAQVYSKSLQEKLNKFISTNELDPDVSVDQHTADLVKLEQMNLFDVSRVINGRIGVYDQSNNFIPGFAVEERAQIFPDDQFGTPSFAEQVLVRDAAIAPVKEAIDTRVSAQRSQISIQERQAAMESTKMLEQGSFTVDRWGEAFSINPESSPQDQILRGLRGEINSKRITTERQLAETIYTAMSKYPTMFGDINNGNI